MATLKNTGSAPITESSLRKIIQDEMADFRNEMADFHNEMADFRREVNKDLGNIFKRLDTREEQAEIHQLKHDSMDEDLEKLKIIHQNPRDSSHFVHI